MRALISFLWTSAILVIIATAEPAVRDSRCPPNEDGMNPTQLPYPNDCTKFLKCSFGYAYPISCPQNQHWSVRMNRCEHPAVAGCDSSIPMVVVPEERKGIPMAACPVNDNPYTPTQLPFPGDCGKFYKCDGGFGYPIDCPDGLHWNTASNRCDWPHEANCAGGTVMPSNPPTRAPTTPTTATPAQNPGSHCPVVDDPSNPVQYAYPGDCGKYYKCLGGVAYPISCSPGLQWSTAFNRCEWPTVANCASVTTRATPTTQSPSSRCAGVDDATNSVQFPYPGDCGRYYKCLNGVAVVITCPTGFHWNSALNICDWPASANCESGVVTPTTTPTTITTQPTTITTQSISQTPGFHCPVVDDPSNPVQYPYPGDCGKFYKCLRGIAYPISCQAGLHWSTTLNRCEWPTVANCASVTTRATPTTQSPSSRCAGVDDATNSVQFPYPGDCGRYYKCLNGVAVVITCPNGFHWNSALNICDWPASANCESGVVTPSTTPTTTAIQPTTQSPSSRCAGVDDATNSVQFPYPGDCGRYYKCLNGVAVVITCPTGFHWNSALNICDWPASANCESGVVTPSTTPTTITTQPTTITTQPTTITTQPTTITTRSTTSTTPSSSIDPKTYCSQSSFTGKKVAYPGDCTRFIDCSKLNIVHCYSSLRFFNSQLGRCDSQCV